MFIRTGRGARFLPLVLSMALVACTVGPDYQRPEIDLGSSFEQLQDNPGWMPAQPGTPAIGQQWWHVFNDDVLDGLMATLNAQNLSIEQAQAQYDQALSSVRSANAALYPTLGLNADVTRADAPIVLPGTPVVAGGSGAYTEYDASLGLSWEIDLWGGIRRGVESAQASAQASAADLAGAKLSAQAALASTYFQVRVLDVQAALLDRTIKSYERSLRMTQSLQRAGLTDKGDVAVAQTQLDTARAQRLDLQWRRAQLENAIAVLLGQAPSSFELSVKVDLTVKPPQIPVGVPSALLQRRPDIAAAERRTAVANAKIGVATAAWFPDLAISASGGYRSRQFAQWFNAPAQFWALGPALAMAIFDGGRRQAQIQEAEAGFRAQAANYRLTSLRALQEVEDALVQLRVLAQVQQVQASAVAAARESLRIRQNQYEKGLVDYLSVAVLETTLLNNERNAIGVMGDRLAASVKLVAALGGGWSANQIGDAGNAVRTP
ncbi:MAG: efflux transporter outer membrane subunit [Burkholderiaceae bacterium]|nr:efflux transporter outer membrane subunit [Burkholderiaceae bacterium]